MKTTYLLIALICTHTLNLPISWAAALNRTGTSATSPVFHFPGAEQSYIFSSSQGLNIFNSLDPTHEILIPELKMTGQVMGSRLPKSITHSDLKNFQESNEKIAVFYSRENLLVIMANGQTLRIPTNYSQLTTEQAAAVAPGKSRGLFFEYYPMVSKSGATALLILGEEFLLADGIEKVRRPSLVLRLDNDAFGEESRVMILNNDYLLSHLRADPKASVETGLAAWVSQMTHYNYPHTWKVATGKFDAYSMDGIIRAIEPYLGAERPIVRWPSNLGIPTFVSEVPAAQKLSLVSVDGAALAAPRFLPQMLEQHEHLYEIPGREDYFVAEYSGGRFALVGEMLTGELLRRPSILDGQVFPDATARMKNGFLILEFSGQKKAIAVSSLFELPKAHPSYVACDEALTLLRF